MNYRLYFIILSLLFSVLISGQTFDTIVKGNNLVIGGEPAHYIRSDTAYVISFQQNQRGAINYRSFDRNGDLIDSNFIYFNDSTIATVAIRPNGLNGTLNQNFLIANQDVFLTSGNAFVKLLKFSLDFDTIETRNWQVPNSLANNSWDIFIDDSTITILGHYALQPSSKLNLFLAQFDTALNLLWYNTVADFRGGPANRFNGFYPYRLQKHGDYYYAVGRCLYPNVMVEGFVVKMDLLGNKVWDKRFRYFGKNTAITDFQVYNDTMLFGAAYLLATSGPDQDFNELYLSSLDTSGNTLSLWPDSIKRYIYQIPSLTKTATGDIVAATTHYSSQTLAAYSELWKLSPTMQTQWRRSKWHGDSLNDQSLLTKIALWSDGGILGTGTHWKTNVSPFDDYVFLWLLSTDSNGCVDSATCYSGISAPLPVTFTNVIKLYPNPASNTVTIQLPINNPFTVGQVVLQSTSGQQMWEQKVVFQNAKADLPIQVSPGLYTIQITTNQGVFHSKLIVQ